MKKEQLENAINRCWVEHHIGNKVLNDDEVKNFNPLPSENFKEGFIAGCEWRINSVWHDVANELPEYNKHVVNEDWFDFEAKDEKDLKRILKNYPFKRWAYVEDLLYTETI